LNLFFCKLTELISQSRNNLNYSNKIHALPLICCIFANFENVDSLFHDFAIRTYTFYSLKNSINTMVADTKANVVTEANKKIDGAKP
jgi:hypothetical protein